MSFRFITCQVHAFLDYPVAASLMAMPFVLQSRATNPVARWLSVGTGVAALMLTLLTDHELGVWRVLLYWFHVTVDRIVGITFAIAPIALGFAPIDAWYCWANAAAVLAVTFVLNAKEQNVSNSSLATAH